MVDDRRGTTRRPHGALKAAVKRILLHEGEPLSMQQIRARFAADEARPAPSTLLTVLERLRRAGEIVRAEEDGGDYLFSLAAEDSDRTAESMLESLLRTNDRNGALVSFAGSLDPDDLAVLRAALGRRRR